MVGKVLDQDYTGDVVHQPKFKFSMNADTGQYLPFDYGLDCKVLIELDGGQHFKQVFTWKSPEETQDRDVYKTKCALAKGYTVIRLLWDDVFYNKNSWRERLKLHLRKHINPRTILLESDKGEYGPLKKKLEKEGIKYATC
jgi:very-short-patch-repair endonuclease